MINVLWLASWYPNRTDAFNGDFIERHAIAVSRYVQLTVLVITKDESLNYNQVEVEKSGSANLTVYKVYYGSSSLGGDLEKILSFKKYLQLQKKYYKEIVGESGEPAIIHVHVAMKAGMLARWLKKRKSTPFLVTEHWSGYDPESRPSIYDTNWLFRQLNKKVLQDAALLLPVSDALGQMINRHFVKLLYKVIPNVVDTGLFFYQPYSAADKRFRFIHPSSMTYPKNPEGILQACKIVKDKGYDFDLLMLGNKDERLVAIADEYNLTGTVLVEPAVPYAEVARQMQASAALLLFSRYENMPCVLLEALCCGLPVVSSRVGGIEEVINDTNGILVEPQNVEELSLAMINIMKIHHQYNRQNIAGAAQSQFSYDTIGKQFLAIYQQYLSRIPALASKKI
jgi:glycosyltransferase involved in cell wall biosynthesis